MILSSRHFKSILPILLIVLLYPATSLSSWKLSYYVRRAAIEGYVFLDKRFHSHAKAYVDDQVVGRVQFFNGVLSNYKNEKPLENATISLGINDVVATTNSYGYFRIKAWWFSARKKSITLSARGIRLTFDLDLKDRLTNFLFIGISENGNARVFSLKETADREKASNAAILVHGFGLDIGSFSPSRHNNSWQAAYDLFTSDPELNEYDFFMVDHWDDQTLVESSFELSCFLQMLTRAYGKNAKIVLLGHSAGGLIVRHCAVSHFYEPGTVTRYLMIAAPNHGSPAGLLHFEPSGNTRHDMDGDGTAAKEILPGSDFLDCLNNRSDNPVECGGFFKIDRKLQNRQGLNPHVPAAVLAGEVKEKMIKAMEKDGVRLGSVLRGWFGENAETWFQETLRIINDNFLKKIPRGDMLVSLESQLIEGVPYEILPYPHGYIILPPNRQDKRYLAMKHFILTGELNNPDGLKKKVFI